MMISRLFMLLCAFHLSFLSYLEVQAQAQAPSSNVDFSSCQNIVEYEKRLACKNDVCKQTFAGNDKQIEQCQVDEAVISESSQYIEKDGRLSPLPSYAYLADAMLVVSALGTAMAFIYSIGLTCTSVSGWTFTIISAIDIVLYLLIITRTNIRLQNLQEALFPNVDINEKSDFFSSITMMITKFVAPLLGKIPAYVGAKPEKATVDGVLNGFQFIIEREEIMRSNLKWLRLYSIALMALTAVGIGLAIYEAIKGPMAGSTTCSNEPPAFWQQLENFLLPPALAQIQREGAHDDQEMGIQKTLSSLTGSEKPPILGKTKDSYQYSYTFSLLTVAIAVVAMVLSKVIIKVPAVKAFMDKHNSFKKAAILRAVSGGVREVLYLIKIILYTQMMKTLDARMISLRQFACNYMNTVEFDFTANSYWSNACSSVGIMYNPAISAANAIFNWRFFDVAIAGTTGPLPNHFQRDEEIFRGCLRKDLFYDIQCNCKKNNSCLDLARDLGRSLPAPLAQTQTVPFILKTLTPLWKGEALPSDLPAPKLLAAIHQMDALNKQLWEKGEKTSKHLYPYALYTKNVRSLVDEVVNQKTFNVPLGNTGGFANTAVLSSNVEQILQAKTPKQVAERTAQSVAQTQLVENKDDYDLSYRIDSVVAKTEDSLFKLVSRAYQKRLWTQMP